MSRLDKSVASQDHASSEELAALVQQCAKLCASAETKIGALPSESATFLAQNLSASMRQVELILRVIDDQGAHRDQERKSFLRRLFGRDADNAGAADGAADPGLPTFDVSSQGLQGNAWTISIAELLGFLAFAHKSGILWVDGPGENFLIGIVEGRLMHASSDSTPEGLRLGEVLVGLGFLTRRQLERFLNREEIANNDAVCGEALLESGMISDEELREALVHQTTSLFSRMIGHQHAVFRFQEGVNVQLAFQVDLDINQLLLDCARIGDEEDNPAALASSILNEWESWRSELSEKAPALAASDTPAEEDDAAGDHASAADTTLVDSPLDHASGDDDDTDDDALESALATDGDSAAENEPPTTSPNAG